MKMREQGRTAQVEDIVFQVEDADGGEIIISYHQSTVSSIFPSPGFVFFTAESRVGCT
jgi:hypothetical protein